MKLLYKFSPREGYQPIISEENKELKYIEFAFLSLEKGQSYEEETGDKEVGLIILSGKCSIEAGDREWKSVGERADVFSGRASGVYVPCRSGYRVSAEDKVEVAVCKVPSKLVCPPRLIKPGDVKAKSVGKDNWRRDVYDIIDLSVEAERLVIGETINPPGNWSSAPPHKHDVDNLPQESDQEELYFFRVSPPQGFGMQRIYSDDGSLDEAYVLENNDTIAIPEGYHPVAAAPGYRLYYLWILAGEKRILQPKDDPRHAWIKG